MNEHQAYIPKGRYSKSKIEKMYQFSPSDLRRFLNKEIYHLLEPLGYNRNCKFLSAKMMQVIIDKLGEPRD